MEERAPEGRQVALVDLGRSNLNRLSFALRALGHTPTVVDRAAAVAEAPLLILGGASDPVGAVASLRRRDLAAGLDARVRAGLPTLAINVGYHALCQRVTGADGRVVDGLGLLPGTVRPLPAQGIRGDALKRPHLGWSTIRQDHPNEWMDGPLTAWFAHDQVVDLGRGWDTHVVGVGEHTLLFPALVARGNLVGAQFHPESSGPAGLAFLSRFTRRFGARAEGL